VAKTKLRVAVAFSAIGLALVPFKGVAQESRIPGLIDSTQTVTLKGNVNPKAQAQYDLGPVDPAFKLNYVTLALKPSTKQQAALEQLLGEQQDRSSPNYHRWLTPEQYADRFGLSVGDITKVTAWLESQGFTINYVARGRNWIAFSGTAEQVNEAFRTDIHYYRVAGETHFANASNPSVPVALESVVRGLLGLDDLRPKAPHSNRKVNAGAAPHNTLANGTYALVPDDIATIYDIARLYQAGIDGSGQRVVVVGASDINLADIGAFRNFFGLPPNIPQTVLYGTDPGTPGDSMEEADLDIEWVGSVARNATIIYVYAQTPFYAVQYAIDQKFAPVISMSFDTCEPEISVVGLNTGQSLAQQANAQGMTWLAASGDSGAAACDPHTPNTLATHAAAVYHPADIPEVTAVGGTEFNEGGGVFWSLTNSTTGESALSYIPEVAWNDSQTLNGPVATGGGFSAFFVQPSWQSGLGQPAGSGRAVPDVALTASWEHDPYWLYTGGQWQMNGGTSASTPVFAGLVALLNQYETSNGQGNINPNLYALAKLTTNVFHDITTGNNGVPCLIGSSADCTTGSFGYFAGPGYDPVTGLGSVDAYNLITEWNAATRESNVVPSCNPDPVYQQAPDSNGFSWDFTLTLSETAGVGTSLTDFTINGTSYASQIVSFFGTSTIPADGFISASLGYKTLTVPTTLVFGFSGVDTGGRQWSRQLSVPFNGMQSSPPPTISLSKTRLQFSWTVGGAVPPSQSITVANSGGGTFTWIASSNVSWLKLSSATGTLTVSLNPTGLALGAYNGTVSVTGTGASNSPQSIGVSLTVEAASPSVVVSAVVNAASYQTGLTPGALATLFGKNLSPVIGVESPGGSTSYKGVSLTVGGYLAPLFTVANVNGQEQINFQVPMGIPGSDAVEPVQVNNNGAIGMMNIATTPVQPGVFAYVPSGSSASYAVIVKPDGSIAGPSNPVARGSTVVMYATGLGPTSPALATGEAGPVPPATTTYVPVVTIEGISAPVLFSGVAPDFVGLDQVNFTIPAKAPVGSDLTLNVTVSGVSSPSLGIAVQ
jgi:uncharacterized protein (TIGR03437 family)